MTTPAKDQDFYNKESTSYSAKRYPAHASSYVQFFFKKRLDIVSKELGRIFGGKTGLNLLEIGCADGIILREIEKNMKGAFDNMIGIDIAPDMVQAAQALNTSPNTRFFLRGNEPSGDTFDVITEIGVANYTDFDDELAYAAARLKDGGAYILTIAGRTSLKTRLGPDESYENFLSYPEYEDKIRGLFSIEKRLAVGFYMPLIWKFPPFARLIQPMLESIFSRVAPNLYHEKIYLLKKRVISKKVTS